MWIWMGCDGIVVFVVPCVGVDVSVNLDVQIKCSVEVNWQMCAVVSFFRYTTESVHRWFVFLFGKHWMRFVCNSHLQFKILRNYTSNDFNCFLASSKGHHQLDSCLRCGIFIRTDDGVRQPTHGNTNLYYLLLFQSWQKQLPIWSQQKLLGRQRQRFEVSQNKKGTWYRSCDRCVGCGVRGALSEQVK